MALPPDTSLGSIRLNAGDQDSLADFYEQTVGLRELSRNGVAALGADDGQPLVELLPAPDAPPRPAGTTGLFHLAILVPSRLELARALRRVTESGWRLTGASDHLVSEALYLRDPEGNGIEIYRDRPRDGVAPRRRRDRDGHPAPGPGGRAGRACRRRLAPRRHAARDPARPRAPERRRHCRAPRAFYAGALGFDVTVRGYPGALFVSAGGYHHHVGLNTWMGEGAPPPPPGARGLDRFEVVVPAGADLDAAERRLTDSGVQTERGEEGLTAVDPSGNRVLLRPRLTDP